MQDFRKIIAWQKAMGFVDAAYGITAELPPKEIYGLSSQLQRASVSIASNIAEGRSRESDKDFARFLEIALGSAFESETLLLIIKSQCPKLWDKVDAVMPVLEEVKKLVFTLRASVKPEAVSCKP